MLKNIVNLTGVHELSASEQKAIIGGIPAGCGYQTWPGIQFGKLYGNQIRRL